MIPKEGLHVSVRFEVKKEMEQSTPAPPISTF